MKSRLEALLSQRELLRAHSQWLDDEIAAERARTGVPSPTPGSTPPPVPRETSAPVVATPVIEAPEADVKGLHNEVRRGCLLYFLLAAAVLGGVIALIYWKYGANADGPLNPEEPPALAPEAAPR